MDKRRIGDIRLRTLFVGERNVGKSTLIKKLFSLTMLPENPIVMVSNIHFDLYGDLITLSNVHFSRKNNFGTYGTSIYNGVKVIFILYSVMDERSFQEVDHWMTAVKRHGVENVVVVLVANKIDLEDVTKERVVSSQRGREYAVSVGVQYCELTCEDAKSVQNITQVFNRAVNSALRIPESLRYKMTELQIDRPIRLELIQPNLTILTTNTCNIDNSISSISSSYTTTKPIVNASFNIHLLFNNKFISNLIFSHVTLIHQTLECKAFTLPNTTISFLLRNRYFTALKSRLSSGWKMDTLVDDIDDLSLSTFLRSNIDLDLFRAMFEETSQNTRVRTPEQCTRLMDECCIGGSLSIVQYVYTTLGYRWSRAGYLMAIALGHTSIVQLIVHHHHNHHPNPAIHTQPQPRAYPIFTYTSKDKKDGKRLATLYNHQSILTILKSKQPGGTIGLMNRFFNQFKDKD